MALTPGTRLGVYEVVASIGAGGMGQVFRARDTKLNRDVAIKILPEAFAHDADRLARFQREAKTLASLNHPNIAAIHGLEESGGVTALVMELVEGDDLSQRIARGAIPLDEALPIAKQIGEALEASHDHGIIHRDLKPANVKVREDGTVKVLDFGLAKALEPTDASPRVSQSPTITSPAMTQAGVILGTAAYMSPEQTRAQRVDKRTDIWAFGAVLFEMLTGRRAFAGDDVSDIIASVLKAEPDWQQLPVETPAVIRRLLRRCLVKERRDRLADMSDARLDLTEAIASPGGAAVDSTSTSARIPRLVAIVLGTVLLAGVASVAIFFGRSAPAAPSAIHSTITSPADVGEFATGPPLALSPDGRYLAFAAADASEGRMLWIRRLDQPTAQPVPGTEGADAPFWSPDSRFVAFIAGGTLKKVDIRGGPVVIVAATAVPVPGSWNDDNVILFNTSFEQLSRVPAAGGTPSPATTLDDRGGERGHSYPFFLPDGRSFLYRAESASGAPDLYVGALDSTERTLVLEGISNAQYASDTLLFLRDSTLMARPFDATRRRFLGDAVPIADQIQLSTLSLTTGVWQAGAFSVSEGTLVFLRSASADSQLVWFDRSGQQVGVLGDPASYADVFLSPRGQSASVSILDPTGTGTRDIWAYDVVRGIRTRVTFDPADEFEGISSPDGNRIAFNSRRKGRLDLYLKPAGRATGSEEVLLEGGLDKYAQSWSPDGESLLYITLNVNNGQDIWVLPLTGDRTPWSYLATPYFEGVGAKFSPDGNWISYTSNETGRQEAYIAGFPKHDKRVRISTNGGLLVTWREDGREVYYYEPDRSGTGGRLLAVDLNYDSVGVKASAPRPLMRVQPGGPRSFYDALPDGQRFLVNSVLNRATGAPITLVVNWPTLIGSAR